MQVGCCIRRALASFGTLTAMALIASTGFAGNEPVSAGDNAAPEATKSSLTTNARPGKGEKQAAKTPYNSSTNVVSPFGYTSPASDAVGNVRVTTSGVARGGVVGGDSCAAAGDLDADLAGGGTVTITGDTTGAPYLADPAVNPELPADTAGCIPVAPLFGGGAKWYSFTGTGGVLTFDGCASGYDTSFTIFTGSCGGVESLVCAGGNGDSATCPDFQSAGTFVTDPGVQYFIMIHGWAPAGGTGEEGPYSFDLSIGAPVTICDAMATPESEGCVSVGPGTDEINGGCNTDTVAPPFEVLTGNDNICGESSLYPPGAVAFRDTDWYILDLTGAAGSQQVTIEFTADFAGVVGVVETADANNAWTDCADNTGNIVLWGDQPTVVPAPLTTVTGVANVPPATYLFFVSNNEGIGFGECPDSGEYNLKVTAIDTPIEACCLGDGTCMDLLGPDCIAMGGEIQSGETCASLAAAQGAMMECIGFCCLLDGNISSPTTADDCAAGVAGGIARNFLGYNLTAQEQMDAECPVTPNNIDCDLADPLTTDGTIVLGSTAGSTFIPASDPRLPGVTCATDFLYTTQPSVWYTFTGTGNTVTVAIDDASTDFAANIYVFCGTADLMAMPPETACDNLICVGGDDDGVGAAELTFCTESGSTYYVLVGGGLDTGNFGISVSDSGTACMDATACAVVDVPCPTGGIGESLEDCVTPPGVEGNDGCDAGTGTTFAAEGALPGDVICGNSGARLVDNGDGTFTGTVDSDWYDFLNFSTTTITIRLTSESPATVVLYDYNNGASDAQMGADCDNLAPIADALGAAATGNGQAPAEITLCLPDGNWFVEVIGDFGTSACNNDAYVLEFIDDGACSTGACCDADGMCVDGVTEADCIATDGVFTAGATCNDVTCLGACCTLGMPGMANICDERSFNACVNDPDFLNWNGIETTCADMDVDCGIRPANDNCEDAILLDADGGTASFAFDTANPVNQDAAVFYSFIGTGNSVTIDLCASLPAGMGDTFTATFNTFCRGCDEQRFIPITRDACPTGTSLQGTLCTEAGTEYLVEVVVLNAGDNGTATLTLIDDMTPCTGAPDCSPLGACCLDEMTAECVNTTQIDCEQNLMGCFLEGVDCGNPGFEATVGATPLVEIGPSSTPLAQVATGNFAGVDDEAVATVALPFDFDFFGTTFTAGTDIYVCVNGFISLDPAILTTTASLFVNAPFPNVAEPNSTIAPQFEDWITNGNADNGLFASSSATELILEWNVSPFAGDDNIVFQAILRDDNSIEFIYDGAPGPAANAGIENAGGTDGVDTTALIAANTSVSLAFIDGPDACPTMVCDGDPEGACCIMGVCSIETEADCLAMGGEYGGDGTTCMDVSCNDCVGDFDNDGDVDLGDFGTFGAAFGSGSMDANYNPAADFDADGDVDLGDFGTFGALFGRTDCHQLILN